MDKHIDKHILHSVLETIAIGSPITVNFNEPFTQLSGDYTVVSSKTGRGRGGSRVMEISSTANPTNILGTLEINGRPRMLGTGTSEHIASVIVDGKTYGLEEVSEVKATKSRSAQPETKSERQARASSSQASRVAQVLGNILNESPETNFKFVANSKSSELNGEWTVSEFTYEGDKLQMKLMALDDPSHTFDFDSTIHGAEIRDAQVIEAS